MYWNDTITLYNKYEDTLTGGVSWYRHILQNCFVKRTNNKINVGGVVLQSDNVIIRIPQNSSYTPPIDWIDIPKDLKHQKMTLQPGDLIFLGEITEEIDEYTPGRRSSDLIAKYSVLGSVYISSVNINTDLPNGHYFVQG